MSCNGFGLKRVRLSVEDGVRPPETEIAVGPALVETVQQNPDQEWLRIYRPAPTMAFSGRDCRSPGLQQALGTARASGFIPVRRAPGGRAVAYHRGSLCIDHVGRTGQGDVDERFRSFGGMFVRTLRTLGVPAQLGPVAGEYCPGQFSVNDGHGRKVIGTAQRVRRETWLFSSVIQISDPRPVREVTTGVYRDLGLELNPSTVGAIADTVAGLDWNDVARALVHTFAQSYDLVPLRLPAAVVTPDPGRWNRQLVA